MPCELLSDKIITLCALFCYIFVCTLRENFVACIWPKNRFDDMCCNHHITMTYFEPT